MQSSGEPPPAGRAGTAVCVAAPAIDGSLTACSPIRLPEQGGVGDQALAAGRVHDMRRESTGIDDQPVDLHEPRPWSICQQLPPAEVWVVVAKSHASRMILDFPSRCSAQKSSVRLTTNRTCNQTGPGIFPRGSWAPGAAGFDISE